MDNIDLSKWYNLLKLDERASLNEVCLAFDVLTKSEKNADKLREYRNAFETIMAFKAPELFGENIDNKESNFKNDGTEQSDNTIQSLNPNTLTIDIISSNHSIPILWLKEYMSDNTKNFLGQKYKKLGYKPVIEHFLMYLVLKINKNCNFFDYY